ncbi:prepilin-type N-terminal cleavage/methylation domain-containing protein [Patescibacteria group bacterium]|nr:prepilin-type N-terminal cleavage/methylation domain-containing protein [Patescibacteria group bacterium]
MKIKNKNLRKGFTLPEVIVAMAVLTLVIFTATNLVVSIIRSNAENVRTLTAYGLAQEGLEAVRNMRDSDWLLGARFNGKLGAFQKDIWGDAFPDGMGEDGYYTVSLGSLVRSPISINSASQVDSLANYVPWKLKSIKGADDTGALIYKFTDKNSNRVLYRNKYDALDTGGEKTPYSRYLYIENISDPGATALQKMRVESIVKWREPSRDKEIKLVTELTDWNIGQL